LPAGFSSARTNRSRSTEPEVFSGEVTLSGIIYKCANYSQITPVKKPIQAPSCSIVESPTSSNWLLGWIWPATSRLWAGMIPSVLCLTICAN